MGTVESFDPEVGLGFVADNDGARHRFHCTAIADGTRTIEVGRTVVFVVGPGGAGSWEAMVVQPLG